MTPGVKAPKEALPTDSESVAGTVPPTVPGAQVPIATFDGSLSEVAVSVTEPVPLKYTGTSTDSPALIATISFARCTSPPVAFSR